MALLIYWLVCNWSMYTGMVAVNLVNTTMLSMCATGSVHGTAELES